MNATQATYNERGGASTEMRQRPLGATGLLVSELGIGCQSFAGGVIRPTDPKLASRIMRKAFDHGVNFFDAAPSYGELTAERLIGDAFRRDRDRIVIAAKIGEYFSPVLAAAYRARHVLKPLGKAFFRFKSPIHRAMQAPRRMVFSSEHIVRSVENTLRAMRTDYLDVCQLADPSAEVVRQGEYLEALQRLRRDGKVRFFGVYCQCNAAATAALEQEEISSIQVGINLLNQSAVRDFLPAAHGKDVGIIAKQALAHAILTDAPPFKAEVMARDLRKFQDGVRLGDQFRFLTRGDRSIAQAALRFVLGFPQVSSIMVGLASEAELDEDLGYVLAPELSEEERGRALELGRLAYSGY